eukprot:scaffold134197_cov18-Tisochrysis_lutea.AAC.1
MASSASRRDQYGLLSSSSGDNSSHSSPHNEGPLRDSGTSLIGASRCPSPVLLPAQRAAVVVLLGATLSELQHLAPRAPPWAAADAILSL